MNRTSTLGGSRESAPTEVLFGLVERVTFHTLESGFCILRVEAGRHRDLVTAAGKRRPNLSGKPFWIEKLRATPIWCAFCGHSTERHPDLDEAWFEWLGSLDVPGPPAACLRAR